MFFFFAKIGNNFLGCKQKYRFLRAYLITMTQEA